MRVYARTSTKRLFCKLNIAKMVICVHLPSIFPHLCRKKAVILQPNFVRTHALRAYICVYGKNGAGA